MRFRDFLFAARGQQASRKTGDRRIASGMRRSDPGLLTNSRRKLARHQSDDEQDDDRDDVGGPVHPEACGSAP